MAKKKTGKTKAASGRAKSASGKSKAASGKMRSAGRSTGRAKAASGRRSGARPAARPKGSGHELVPVICSECYEELMFDSGVQSEGLVCPICEHEAGRPDDATLHHISEKRRQEKSAFTISAAIFLVGLISFGAWAVLMRNPANAAESGLFWGPLGVALLCAVGLAAFAVKYEGNRWEVYF